jgi:hypothetical protein
MIFDIAPTMLTGYYRIRDPAAFIMHGNPRAKDIVCFVFSTTASSCLADSFVLPVLVGCTSVFDYYQGVSGSAALAVYSESFDVNGRFG